MSCLNAYILVFYPLSIPCYCGVSNNYFSNRMTNCLATAEKPWHIVLPVPIIKLKKYTNSKGIPIMEGSNRLSLLISLVAALKLLPKSCPHKLHKQRCIHLVLGVLAALGETRNHFKNLRVFLRSPTADSSTCSHNLSRV